MDADDRRSDRYHGVVEVGLIVQRALISLLLVSLGLSVAACGHTGASSVSKAARDATSPSGAAPGRLRGDEDDDDNNSETENLHNPADGDADRDHDYNENVINGYYDSDDATVRNYGHAAGAADKLALTSFVKRYFAAAAAEDGAMACSMIKPSFVRAIPEDYGSGAGPAYMRGKTCTAVMSLLFKHFHTQLSAPVVVSSVRVDGDKAEVIVGSTTTPVSYLPMEREGSAWRLVELLGAPLP